MPEPVSLNPLSQIGEVSKAIDRVGAPSLMAFGAMVFLMYFLWAMLGRLEAIEKHQSAQEAQGWMVVGYMQKACLRDAQTPEARIECVVAKTPEGAK